MAASWTLGPFPVYPRGFLTRLERSKSLLNDLPFFSITSNTYFKLQLTVCLRIFITYLLFTSNWDGGALINLISQARKSRLLKKRQALNSGEAQILRSLRVLSIGWSPGCRWHAHFLDVYTELGGRHRHTGRELESGCHPRPPLSECRTSGAQVGSAQPRGGVPAVGGACLTVLS